MRLASHVLALSRSLFAADLAAALAEEGEEGSELQASLAEAVEVRFEPGPVLHPPADTGGDGIDVRRLYERNCADCHGAEGRGDGTREIAVGTRNGWLYAWHTEGKLDGRVDWASYHHDDHNTRNLATPIGFGSAASRSDGDCG